MDLIHLVWTSRPLGTMGVVNGMSKQAMTLKEPNLHNASTVRWQTPQRVPMQANAPNAPTPWLWKESSITHDITHLSRSACGCLLPASPLNADRLSDVIPLQLPLEVEASGWSLTSVTAMSSPRSRSVSRGIGIAAEGDSLVVSAACAWTSSTLSGYGVGALDTLVLEDGLAIERTTSPLQIGHVRRRVVSQGVLVICQHTIRQISRSSFLTCTRRGTRGRMVGSSLYFHHPHTPQDIPHTRPACQRISCEA